MPSAGGHVSSLSSANTETLHIEGHSLLTSRTCKPTLAHRVHGLLGWGQAVVTSGHEAGSVCHVCVVLVPHSLAQYQILHFCIKFIHREETANRSCVSRRCSLLWARAIAAVTGESFRNGSPANTLRSSLP